MKEVSIYIVTGNRGRWQQDGHIGYALEYYKENSKYPAVIKEVVPVQQQNENRSTPVSYTHLDVYKRQVELYSTWEEVKMTDSKKLSDEIADSGITITAIAKKLGITREGFYKKLNNETEFKASEISALQKILRLKMCIRDREK